MAAAASGTAAPPFAVVVAMLFFVAYIWLKIYLLLAVTETSFFWVVFLVRTFLAGEASFLNISGVSGTLPETIELLLFDSVADLELKRGQMRSRRAA